MNPLIGASFYESLTRLAIGILFAVTGILAFDCSCSSSHCFFYQDTFLAESVLVIICYIIGLLFSLFVDWLAESDFCKCYFYKNDIAVIKTFLKEQGCEQYRLSDDDTENYCFIYYEVQREGLLGNVTALEAVSSFLLNFGAFNMLLMLVSVINYREYSNASVAVFCIALLLVAICNCARGYVEKRIYLSIISAYKYLIKTGKIEQFRKKTSERE